MPGINLIITTQADVSQDVLLEYTEARLNLETPELFDHYLKAIETDGVTVHRKQPRPLVPGYPDSDETLELITEWLIIHDRLEKAWRSLEGGLSTSMAGTPLFEAVWFAFEGYTKTLAQLIGDTDAEWLNWYWLENDMGRKEHEAGYDGTKKPIRNTADLTELILEERNRS